LETLAIPLAVALGAIAILIGFYIGSRTKSAGPTTIHPLETSHAIENSFNAANNIANASNGDIDDLAVFTISRVFERSGNLEPLQVPSETKDSLGRLLQCAPRAVVATAETGLAIANTFVIAFQPKTMLRLATGTLEMMAAKRGGLRAIARGSGIVEHGRLFSVASIPVSCAVWQVLAIITAQKFLSDINQRLKSIETKLERIEKWLQHDRYGALKANLAYVEDILNVFLSGQLQPSDIPTFRVELENIERECSRFTYASQADSEVPISEAAGVQLSTFWTSPSLDKPLELIEYFNTTARFQLMAIHVRLAAIRVADALGSDEQMASQRTKRIREQLGAFDKLATTFSKSIDERISSARVKIDLSGKTDQTRETLQQSLQASLQEAREYKEQLLKEVGDIDTQLERGQLRVCLTVDLNEDGSVKQISRMLGEDAIAGTST
jgi:hypothetical protein